MLSLGGIGCKEYLERVGKEVPLVICPDLECRGTRLQGHGWYHRLLAGKRQPVRRGVCPRCGVSHALLPEDLCAYQDATFETVAAALDAGGPSAGAKASGQSSAQGVRRVRRWLRSEGAAWACRVSALLPATDGPWWKRAQTIFGAHAGWLTRLRSYLWSSYLCFLGGVHGLYRLGRPRYAWTP